ncbi:hypothetical protein [uncultured Caulobacter sp.]|uniref:hypothetical protein n=1 Tax=uncultured Caulobacter sp. TaxID=158749 RepID=UPI0026195853|nr:hypothetical protein [uncultured Caulobacter sp.]
MLRHALALLAALAFAFSPLAVSAARAECDMGGMDAMAMAAPADAAASADPCCDHGKTMSAKDCAKACSVSCAPSVAAPAQAHLTPVVVSYRAEASWSNTGGRTRVLVPEDPPPRTLA